MQLQNTDPRMQTMFAGDRRWALFAIVVLWLTYAFVFWKVMPNVVDGPVLIALAVSGTLVLTFNTAAILAMISHYAEDKENIYGLDIHYLDAAKRSKS